MKIPKYIDVLIQRRMKLAMKLQDVSSQLDDWLIEQGISTQNDYMQTGCMIYCEPHTAAECVREDIENFEK